MSVVTLTAIAPFTYAQGGKKPATKLRKHKIYKGQPKL